MTDTLPSSPPKAGTHTAESIDRPHAADDLCNNEIQWLWVLAFAGTTAECEVGAMTDLPASKVDLKAILSAPSRVDNSEGMSYLQSLPRRLVTLYLPLSIIVFILLFPFYWMGLTAIKPDEQLLDLDKYNPFWTWNPTFK